MKNADALDPQNVCERQTEKRAQELAYEAACYEDDRTLCNTFFHAIILFKTKKVMQRVFTNQIFRVIIKLEIGGMTWLI